MEVILDFMVNTEISTNEVSEVMRNNVSRLKTPDGENVRSSDLRFSNKSDVGTVLDETGNEHQNYSDLC